MKKIFIIELGYITAMIRSRIEKIERLTIETKNPDALKIEVSIDGADDTAIEATVETIKKLGSFVKSVTEKPQPPGEKPKS
jgi:ribose 5-phosphate isomerase